MNGYFAVIFTDLVRHSAAWSKAPRNSVTNVIAEYRYLAQSVASQYGRRHENFTGDGHLFLFESADLAAHFGLKLIAYWKFSRRSLIRTQNLPDLPIRLGCHFGECSQVANEEAWIGRAISIAKRVESNAQPDSMFVTQTILELIDLPIYEFSEVGTYQLRGDFLPHRQLYRLSSVDQSALADRPVEKMSAEDWFLKGVNIAELGAENREEELECYRHAIRLRPGYPEAHNNLAVLLKSSCDEIAAINHYEEALRLWPGYPEAHYNYAILLETLDKHADAAIHYREAIRCQPDYTDARLRYAGLLASKDERNDAERHYKESLRLRPGYAEAHNNYGVFLEKRGDLSGAESHYNKALTLRPDYAEAHYNYALLLERTDTVKAKEHYRAAINAFSDYAEAHNNLAILLQESDDLTGAEEHYLAALRLRPYDPETNYNFALLAKAKGNTEVADQYLRLSRELAVTNSLKPTLI